MLFGLLALAGVAWLIMAAVKANKAYKLQKATDASLQTQMNTVNSMPSGSIYNKPVQTTTASNTWFSWL